MTLLEQVRSALTANELPESLGRKEGWLVYSSGGGRLTVTWCYAKSMGEAYQKTAELRRILASNGMKAKMHGEFSILVEG